MMSAKDLKVGADSESLAHYLDRLSGVEMIGQEENLYATQMKVFGVVVPVFGKKWSKTMKVSQKMFTYEGKHRLIATDSGSGMAAPTVLDSSMDGMQLLPSVKISLSDPTLFALGLDSPVSVSSRPQYSTLVQVPQELGSVYDGPAGTHYNVSTD